MKKDFDIVVVGGGIQGCGAARSAAKDGLKVLLIEQNTWANATSSSSSKLIHGGLRYLQTYQFSLVRESLKEREWMLKTMPELVKINWFYFPIYTTSVVKAWLLHMGLMTYWVLSGFSKHATFRRIPKAQWSKLNGLNTKNLQAVFCYQDAQTDDLLLTRQVQKEAAQNGATCLEHTHFKNAVKCDEGYQVTIERDGVEQTITTKLIVNASGPWVNKVFNNISPNMKRREIDLVQGSHIIIKERISDHCFYLQVPSDQRIIFVLPWKDKTMIGTTETNFTGDPADCTALASEMDYLLDTVKHYFPEQSLTIIDSFSGLRVLPQSKGSAFSRPRDVMIQIDENLISVYGGKLTGWRSTSKKILKVIHTLLGDS